MTVSNRVKRRLNASKKQILGSVEVVTISAAEYAELLASRDLLDTIAGGEDGRPHSPIDADPKLKAFIAARLGAMPLTEIAEACRKEFDGRSPSISALHRFSQRQQVKTFRFSRWRSRFLRGL